MSLQSQADARTARFQYLANDRDLAVYIASTGGGEVKPHQGNYVVHDMPLENGRLSETGFDLDQHGFKLVSQETAITDFYNDTTISAIYEAEVRALMLQHTGARRVEIFDHTRRTASEALRLQKKIREPASVIHNDYTEKSAPQRLRDLYPDEADALLESRFAIVNLWRSINGSVQNHHLCMCDATSVDAEDLIAVARQAKDRMGEIQLAIHNPAHRWIYFPQMTQQEALIFKTYDSATDGRTRFTIHTAFDDPAVARDAPPRESMETRCFVFF